MKTISEVHSPEQRTEMRAMGERRAMRSQIRLIACVSILRTMVTEIFPLCASAGWWAGVVCLLPGIAVYALLCLAMHLTGTQVIADCLRKLLGKWAVWTLSTVIAALLLIDGAASMTTLITMFTEGIGTLGTQLTLAILTAAALMFCLNREGLYRGIFFLRKPILLLLLAIGVDILSLGSPDNLLPWLGTGERSLWTAFRCCCAMGWPLVLLLTMEPVEAGRSRMLDLAPPVSLCVVCGLLINLVVPCELLIAHPSLADSLIIPTTFINPLIKTLAQCLWMLAFFLHIGSTVRLGADQLLAPFGREYWWLAGGLAAVIAATQLIPIRSLWAGLGIAVPWFALLLAVHGLLAVSAAVVARHRRKTA